MKIWRGFRYSSPLCFFYIYMIDSDRRPLSSNRRPLTSFKYLKSWSHFRIFSKSVSFPNSHLYRPVYTIKVWHKKKKKKIIVMTVLFCVFFFYLFLKGCRPGVWAIFSVFSNMWSSVRLKIPPQFQASWWYRLFTLDMAS